ncbi:hypothetical protein SK069_07320 [Patulibacter brassicae]|uniref:SH3 domain-containing protein n=1 Tax=Patulibacter brassicae TaxID=1705717 RepID=A0ABU4VJ07_9ACTN|nr:hypothetical protein [Patulibacter brassicae]MDX8151395.1 hypothetical protein [Patulibacter brassicae]
MSPRLVPLPGRRAAALVLAMTSAAVVAPAAANADRATGPGPWKADRTYLARQSLDGRTAPQLRPRAKIDHVRAGQWVRIACQTTGEAAYGSRIWSKVGAYYVPDAYLRTFTTGFLPGVPRCRTATPPAPTPSATYRAAQDLGFGAVPHGATRVVRETGARTPDDGVLVLRWFIPNRLAGGRLLRGDGRGFSSATSASSRAYLVWDVATGRTSLTVTPTHIALGLPDRIWLPHCYGPVCVPRKTKVPRALQAGREVPALPTVVRSLSGVRNTDFRSRATNDVAIARSGRGLRVKASLLNSVTNTWGKAGAWSVDYDLTVRYRSGGGYDFDVSGNGYPALESYYYHRSSTTVHRRFQRRIDPAGLRKPWSLVDPGGGVAALDDASRFRCTETASGGSSCAKRGGGLLRKVVRSASYTTTGGGRAE